MRWDLKEAEGKALARRTEIAYKAFNWGEEAINSKAQYLHGTIKRRCGGYKCEGRASYPGRFAVVPLATSTVRCWDGAAEVSRGHSRFVAAN